MTNIPIEVSKWLTRKKLQYPKITISDIERYENIYEVSYNTHVYDEGNELITGTAFIRVEYNRMSDSNLE